MLFDTWLTAETSLSVLPAATHALPSSAIITSLSTVRTSKTPTDRQYIIQSQLSNSWQNCTSELHALSIPFCLWYPLYLEPSYPILIANVWRLNRGSFEANSSAPLAEIDLRSVRPYPPEVSPATNCGSADRLIRFDQKVPTRSQFLLSMKLFWETLEISCMVIYCMKTQLCADSVVRRWRYQNS